MEPITCQDVANFFLLHASQDEEAELVTNLKLQKLVYYAQGFHLAACHLPLFDEKIVAWRHGPVVQELYNTGKKYGSSPIPVLFDAEDSMKKFTKTQKELLSDIYQVYGQYTAWRLRDMTHEEMPWVEADSRRKADETVEITVDVLRKFFQTRLIHD